ncbi:outer membrane lipid asymmetry maintenance protein MlaD [Amylibacter marinus]|uniref:Outer membrane lipid asymmetry maintenance protein MlaD n=1 Tax=Amylibacter marinus TaxID=1475483 RepID=A0ABQ5VSU8_9RHOB|nr:outer membrane lipid asymmetry maintenance protein MlaD [Amylibacter marinus]GLQ34360.1 outer membrane lipid asymmetry maintenance protein MlaD [Amylibacter marinus]
MSNSKMETGVGAVVLIAAIGFLSYLVNSSGVVASSEGFELKASFRSADGIGAGTDVRMAGVKIGTVTDLALDPESFRAEVVLELYQDLKIPDDSGVAVSQEGLLGGSFVEILPGGSDFAMERGGEFLDTQGSVSLVSLLLKFVSGNK